MGQAHAAPLRAPAEGSSAGAALREGSRLSVRRPVSGLGSKDAGGLGGVCRFLPLSGFCAAPNSTDSSRVAGRAVGWASGVPSLGGLEAKPLGTDT